MNFWLVCHVEQDVLCVSAQRQIQRRRIGRERSNGEHSGVCASHCLGMKECFVLLKLSIQKTTRLHLLFSFPSLLFGDKTSAQYHCDTTSLAFKGCAVRKLFRHSVALSGCCGLNFFLAFFQSEKSSTVLSACVYYLEKGGQKGI